MNENTYTPVEKSPFDSNFRSIDEYQLASWFVSGTELCFYGGLFCVIAMPNADLLLPSRLSFSIPKIALSIFDGSNLSLLVVVAFLSVRRRYHDRPGFTSELAHS